MASEGILKLSYKQLEEYTNCFHEEKFLGNFQFGKLYRGMIGEKEVTVKIWQDDVIYRVYPGDNEKRLQNELELLKLPEMKSNLNVVKLIGYCLEGKQLGVVYDLKPLDTLHNLLLKDEFTWVPRIKVAFGLAGLLRFLHFQNSPDLPYWVCNISAAHILLDQDGNPKLCDFGMITGGIFQGRTKNIDLLAGCYGYVDPSYLRRGKWSDKCDVFAFGVVLLGLITKRVFLDENRTNFDIPSVHGWANSEYYEKTKTCGQGAFSLVHGSLEADPTFDRIDGPRITELAIQCVQNFPGPRPNMKEVLSSLLKLRVGLPYVDVERAEKCFVPGKGLS